MPLGKNPPGRAHKWLNEAFSPETGSTKPIKIKYAPVKTKPMMAMILVKANQNSISPNSFTVSIFMLAITMTQNSPGSQSGMFGHQNCI